jgi:rRNA maturation endonuclease Nob1
MSDPISYMPFMVKKDDNMNNNCNYSGLASTESWGKPICEMCNKIMNQEDHDFCDLCDDCRPEEF